MLNHFNMCNKCLVQTKVKVSFTASCSPLTKNNYFGVVVTFQKYPFKARHIDISAPNISIERYCDKNIFGPWMSIGQGKLLTNRQIDRYGANHMCLI